MTSKEKLTVVIQNVKTANTAIKRDMGKITLADRMELLPDAETKYALTNAIKELENTLRELKKY